VRLTPKQRRVVWLAVGIPAALIVWGFVGDHLLDPSDGEPAHEVGEYSNAARLLLGGLAPGDEIEGWRVTSIEGPSAGVIEVRVQHEDQAFSLWISRTGAQQQLAPAKTEKYDISFGRERVPPQTHVAADQVQAVLDSMTRRLLGTEANTPAPDGM